MRLIDADNLSRSCCNSKICSNCDDMYKGENVRVNCSEVRYYYLQMINGAPTVEAIPVKDVERWDKRYKEQIMSYRQIVDLLCKQLEDRCPPDRECIVSGYEGTCEECWKEWCRDVLNER